MADRKLDEHVSEPAELGPLPSGRHSIAPEVLAHNQRERLLAAMAELVGEQGYGATTIREIADGASVSRRTLYEHYSGKEEIFIAAYTAVDDYLAKLMADAAEEEDEWPDQVAAALAAMIRFLASRPNLARLYLVEAAAAGEPLFPARRRAAERLIALLEPGRERAAMDPADGMEEALMGGVLMLLGRRVIAGEGAELAAFIPALIEFSLSPYLGAEAAREVAMRYA